MRYPCPFSIIQWAIQCSCLEPSMMEQLCHISITIPVDVVKKTFKVNEPILVYLIFLASCLFHCHCVTAMMWYCLGNSFADNNRQRFSAKDRDQDTYRNNCAQVYRGGWWFTDCFYGHLNGMYIAGGQTSYGQGIIWSNWKGFYYSLKRSEMKIRPAY